MEALYTLNSPPVVSLNEWTENANHQILESLGPSSRKAQMNSKVQPKCPPIP